MHKKKSISCFSFSFQIHLYSAFHNIHCFRAALQKAILSKMAECFKIKQVFGLADMADRSISRLIMYYCIYCVV